MFGNVIGVYFQGYWTGLPSKTIVKSIESLITYPHSESERFEKRVTLETR